ncbi:MAG TPA: TonB-dependent receptor [Caulobacteraceae bacterium]|jgi:iron complex outermembrane receptor protein
MNKSSLRLTASALALAVPLAAAATARAADADATAGQSSPVATEVGSLTITAERRTINAQDAPLAASVIAGADLQTQGIQNVDDLQFHTPSLTVTDFGQGNLFNIRGIGKDLTNVQTPSGVVTYWDGIAAFPGFFQDAPYYDIANVEVLRGPQGTFAGQNATGGAVFITTNDPSTHAFSADAEGQVGNYADIMARGYVNLPINDNWALRVAVDGESRGSFYRVSGPATTPDGGTPGRLHEESIRVGLLWQPNEALKVVLKGEYNYIDHGGSLADTVQNPLNPAQLNPSDPFTITNNTKNYGTDKFYRLSLNASYQLADGITLRSISSYQYGITNQNVDLDGTSAFPFTFSDYADERIYSEELNAVSPDQGPLRWVAGLYFQNDTVDLPPGTGFDIGLPPGGFDINIIYHTPKATDAVFGQITYDLTPTLQLQAGARFTHSNFTLDDNNFVNNNPAAGLILHASTDDNAVTGKVALNYRPNDANTFYVFVAEGHKQNGINTDPATPFGPEDVTDFEGGWKPTFFDGHLRAQLGVYYSLYQHFQLQFTTPSETNLIQNAAGTTRIYGVELGAQAVFGALSFDASASYEHSSLGSALIVDPTTGLPIQLGGRQLALAPDWTGSIGAQYAFAMPYGGTLTPRIDYSYVAGQWSTPFQRFGEFLPARNLVNAELAYAKDAWKLTLYATNAFNLHYIIASNVGVPFSLRYAGPPGQYGVRVERRF